MNEIALRTVGLGKMYQIGRQKQRNTTLRDSIVQAAKRPIERIKHPGAATHVSDTLWALRDVDLEVRRGDVVGIIGRNGAGKSTLLKILSHITEPTEGRAEIRGRVASLLEVGTGFHAELTGRENILLNGAILGMSRAEIRRKFDEIVEFSEIGRFLDTPVKRYSSGMYIRLAFAVAAHLEPEVLVVDEVLAVGDAEFQKKCLGRMGEVGQGGRTVLFVSHNMAAVKTLCSRGILLERGRVAGEGPIGDIVESYLSLAPTTGRCEVNWTDGETSAGSEHARLLSARLLNSHGEVAAEIPIEEGFTVEIRYEAMKPQIVLNLSLSVYSSEGVYVLASPSGTDANWYAKPHPAGTYAATCRFPGGLFNHGRCHLAILLVEDGHSVIAQVDRALTVDLVDLGEGRKGYLGYWGGVVRPTLEWSTARELEEAKTS